MKNYTYNDWWDGYVVLETCPRFFKPNEKITVCSWDNFNEGDKNEIKRRQEDIFISQTNELFEKWLSILFKNLERSEYLELALQREINYFKTIIFFDKNTIPLNTQNFTINRVNGESLIFEPFEFLLIRQYIDNVIIAGNETKYDFIHSPNFLYQRKDLSVPFQVYAKVLWDYYKWLKVLLFEITKEEYEHIKINDLPVPVEKRINYFNLEMPIDFAENHFKVLTDNKYKKNHTPFLSEDEFKLFIQRAFEGKKEIDKQFLKTESRQKGFIVKLFYQFYSKATNSNANNNGVYEETGQCRDKYIKLLTDNFSNWSFEEIKNNFNDKAKKNW